MTRLRIVNQKKQQIQNVYNYVYILLCNNNSYYTGYTTNIIRRYQEHVNGTAKCRFTRAFKPLKIARCWKVYGDKSIAMKVEKYIKSLNRKEKQYLIDYPYALLELRM